MPTEHNFIQHNYFLAKVSDFSIWPNAIFQQIHFIKIHSALKWKIQTQPKRCGCLGLRRMSNMNNALTTKMGWSLLIKEGKMWVRLQITSQRFFKVFYQSLNRIINFSFWVLFYSQLIQCDIGLSKVPWNLKKRYVRD